MLDPQSSSRRQRVCILGATGSIGTNTLDVLSRHPDQFEVWALTGASRVDELMAQCRQWQPRYAVMPDAALAARLRAHIVNEGLRTEVLSGAQALIDVASHSDVDVVMGAIVGAAGLPPCLAAARAGKRLLLANKEALVVGGALFMRAVEEGGGSLLPIDSEHSAIFQCLPEDPSAWSARIDHIVLTASGGPFRQRDPATFGDITPDQACAHPNWVMGRKISVDSATMMNKALEVIEARWLFNLSPDQIRVVLHPQSIIHSMVVCRDRSVLAELGWERLKGEAGSTCVLNAANEIAVEAFLARRIRFDQIHQVNVQSLSDCRIERSATDTVEGLLDLDGQARRVAKSVVAGLAV